MQIFVTKEKVLSLRKFSSVAVGGKGGFAPPFWFPEKAVLEQHETTRKPTIVQKK